MGDFLSFRWMVTPRLIQVIYVLATAVTIIAGAVSVIAGLVTLARDDAGSGVVVLLVGLGWLLLGPIIIRVYCEFLILFFRMNETLSDIDRKLDAPRDSIDPSKSPTQHAAAIERY